MFFIHRLLGTLADSSLAIVKKAAVIVDMQVLLLYVDYTSFRYMPKRGVAGS
jgi:hypothetical protein